MFEPFREKINQYDSIVIFGHLNPDGDCYGSQIALREILHQNYPNKKIYAVGSGLNIFYSYLGHMDVVSDEIITNSLAVILDSNDLIRLEDKRAPSALDFVKIDHHINTFSFIEGPEIVDTNACSTAELIYRLATESGLSIPKIAANALYLGMLTDTGRFQYVNDYVTVFSILKDLCLHGAEPKIISQISSMTNEQSLKIKAFVLNNYKTNPKGIIYLIVSKADRDALGITAAKMVGQVTLLDNITGYPIWFIATETDNHGLQAELRSLNVDVQHVAIAYGGGGHRFAAGFSYPEYSIDKVNELIKRCEDSLEE